MTTIKKSRRDAAVHSGFALTSSTQGMASDMLDLRGLSRMLLRRIKLIMGVTFLCVLASIFVSAMLTPLYRSEAVLMLDQRQKKVVETGSIVSSLPGDNASLRSELDIMTSREVIDRVIQKFNLLQDPELHPWQRTWTHWVNPAHWFTADKAVSQDVETQRAMAETAQSMLARLKVSNDGRSFSIRISFESKDPNKAAMIANAVADEYLVDQLEAKYQVTARANKWLNERITSLRKQVETSEKAVEAFRQRARLIEIDGSTVSARQMEAVNSQLTEARGQTSQAEARLRSAQSMVREHGGFEAAADVLASPLIQRLREQEAELRRSEADMQTRYGDRHPKMIKIQAEIKDLQNKIAEEVQKIIRSLANEVTVARAKELQFSRDLQLHEDKAGVESRNTVQLRQLQREADANRTLYETFLSRFKQTSEQQDLQLADSRIIARADPAVSAFFPQKALFLLVGSLLGFLLGLLAAYLVEYFDNGFRNADQVEGVTGCSAIGVVPFLRLPKEKTPEDYVVEKPLSAYSEALRTVRTAVHFSDVDHPPKTLLVTSATPGEGKTTFCLSMARSLAKTGKKILLIDADLRRPRIGRIIKSKTKVGLVELLAGSRALADVIVKDKTVEGLDLILAHGKTPNAQDLLGSQQMKKLLKDVSAQYDLVIVDTPPILAVSDAAMASQAVDATLFIVRWAITPRDTVVQALKQLQSFNCKISGIVLTQVDLDQMARYGDAYQHYRYHEYYTN